MKKIFCLIFLIQVTVTGCKKQQSNNTSELSLLQHRWGIVSVNGEALRYVGVPADYFDFATDGRLYSKIDMVLDTSAYTLVLLMEKSSPCIPSLTACARQRPRIIPSTRSR